MPELKKRPSVLHIARIEHVDKNGKVLWAEENIDNMLHFEGEQALLSAFFATTMAGYGAAPANLYLGLDARATLAATDTLAQVSGEPSGNGYARKALSTAGTGISGQDFYIQKPGAYYRADSKVLTFTATAAWAAVTHMFLCTAASGTTGKLICSLDLSAPRTLLKDDSLNCSILVGLTE